MHETTTFLLITFTKYSPFLTYRAQYRRTDGRTDGRIAASFNAPALPCRPEHTKPITLKLNPNPGMQTTAMVGFRAEGQVSEGKTVRWRNTTATRPGTCVSRCRSGRPSSVTQMNVSDCCRPRAGYVFKYIQGIIGCGGVDGSLEITGARRE